MAAQPNAVELTVEQAWFIAETIGAGTFPWVLAITMPYTAAGERGAFMAPRGADAAPAGWPNGSGRCASRTAGWICDTWDPAKRSEPTSCCAGSSRGVATKPEK